MRLSYVLCVLLSFFMSPVVMADAAAQQGPSLMSNLFLLAGFLLIFYFMLIRPQTKRAKDHQNLISNITKDDEVIINGGILGKVQKVTDQYFVVAVAEGTEITVQKQAISASVPKGTMKNI
jgi:preprotein translocase subunit YajC